MPGPVDAGPSPDDVELLPPWFAVVYLSAAVALWDGFGALLITAGLDRGIRDQGVTHTVAGTIGIGTGIAAVVLGMTTMFALAWLMRPGLFRNALDQQALFIIFMFLGGLHLAGRRLSWHWSNYLGFCTLVALPIGIGLALLILR